MSDPAVCQVSHLSVRRGGSDVLKEVSFDLPACRIMAVLGPNGAGKSSLLSVMAGDLKPFAGKVLWKGVDLPSADASALARTRAVLTQENFPAFGYTAAEVVSLGLLPWDGLLEHRREDEMVADSLRLMDVLHLADRPIAELSVGERQRVHLARVFAQLAPGSGQPRWLLLDEPGASLDPRHLQLLLRHLRVLAADGVGILMILHDVNQALRHATHALVLGEGRVQAHGPVGEAVSPEIMSRVFGLPARWAGTGNDRWLVVGES